MDAAILTFQDKGEEIGLRKLVGFGRVQKAADLVGVGMSGDIPQFIAGLVQDAARDGIGAGRQRADRGVSISLIFWQPQVGVGAMFEHEDGALGELVQAAAFGTALGSVEQAGGAVGVEAFLPGIEGMFGDAGPWPRSRRRAARSFAEVSSRMESKLLRH